jgi:hypothetical protein
MDILGLAQTAGRAALALFVDDAAFAVAIFAWVVLVAVAARRMHFIPAGPVLAIGLAMILIASVQRRARQRRAPRL